MTKRMLSIALFFLFLLLAATPAMGQNQVQLCAWPANYSTMSEFFGGNAENIKYWKFTAEDGREFTGELDSPVWKSLKPGTYKFNPIGDEFAGSPNLRDRVGKSCETKPSPVWAKVVASQKSGRQITPVVATVSKPQANQVAKAVTPVVTPAVGSTEQAQKIQALEATIVRLNAALAAKDKTNGEIATLAKEAKDALAIAVRERNDARAAANNPSGNNSAELTAALKRATDAEDKLAQAQEDIKRLKDAAQLPAENAGRSGSAPLGADQAATTSGEKGILETLSPIKRVEVSVRQPNKFRQVIQDKISESTDAGVRRLYLTDAESVCGVNASDNTGFAAARKAVAEQDCANFWKHEFATDSRVVANPPGIVFWLVLVSGVFVYFVMRAQKIFLREEVEKLKGELAIVTKQLGTVSSSLSKKTTPTAHRIVRDPQQALKECITWTESLGHQVTITRKGFQVVFGSQVEAGNYKVELEAQGFVELTLSNGGSSVFVEPKVQNIATA